MKNLVREYFDQQAILADDEWSLFESKLFERRFRKGSIVISEGETENYLSFIISGSVRMFAITHAGDDITVEFCSAPGFCSSYTSFINRTPSQFTIEALSDLTLVSISYDDLQMAYGCSATGERLGRINAERYLHYKEERQISLLTKSATERYLELLETQPALLQITKLQHIASYLGIKPESLSRIRKSMNVAIN